MDSTPTTWLLLFDEYHRVVKAAGEILRDADRLLAQRNFKTAMAQNVVGTEGSANMDTPERWVPGWYVRFYQSEVHPTIFVYVAVFLHDRGGTEDIARQTRLREPLVVAGVLRSASETPCTFYYSNAKWWFWAGGEADGPPVSHLCEAGNKQGQASFHTFAVRLERIKGLADLEQIVIEPLVSTSCMSPVLPCDGWKSQAVVHDGNGIEVDRACS